MRDLARMLPLAGKVFGSLLLTLLWTANGNPRPSSRVPAVASALADECLSVPGYRLFRSELSQVVAERNPIRLRALFLPKGTMRVWGLGGPAGLTDWGLERPEAERMWLELEMLICFGCAIHGDTLLLPKMAALTENARTEPDSVIVLENTTLRSRPSVRSSVLKNLRAGDTLIQVSHGEHENWLRARSGRIRGYIPAADVRSPTSFRLVLVRRVWRISEFGDGV